MIMKEFSDRNIHAITLAPTRICLAGEDLDWIGGRSVCVAIDLYTRVSVSEGESAHDSEYYSAVWSFVRQRGLSGASHRPTLSVTTTAPIASGIGSSSSLVFGLLLHLRKIRAVKDVSDTTLVRLAYEVEYAITRGGGMDHLSIALGYATYTRGRLEDFPSLIGQQDLPRSWRFILMDSGQAKDCGNHIARVRHQLESNDAALRIYQNDSNRLSRTIWNAISQGDLCTFGGAVNKAHSLMRDVQLMSTHRIERLRVAALDAGFVAVKLTGSGGGGCLFAVHDATGYAKALDRLRARLREDIYSPARLYEVSPVRGAH